MSARTITVRLTEAQYNALAGAVALAESDWASMSDDEAGTGERYFATQLGVLGRAWSKINAAWYAKEQTR